MTRIGRLRVGAIAVAIVAVFATIGVGAGAVFADTPPNLPPISAEALLASSLTALSQPTTISGDVRTRVDIGLPDLPTSLSGVAGTGAALSNELASLIGTQRYRVWSSPDGLRIQHPMDFQEQDLVASKAQAWFWDSTTNSATELRIASLADSIPARLRAQMTSVVPTPPSPADVLGLARQALKEASTCGTVAVSGTSTVAGRPAYDLTFTPTSTITRVGSITLAVDAQTRLPLDVQVFPRNVGAAALEAGFTSVSLAPIDPAMFTFTPPADATVRDLTGKVAGAIAQGPPQSALEPVSAPAPKSVTFGNCVDLRIALPLDGPVPSQIASLLPYAGQLVSAMTVDRGGRAWLLVGFVDVGTLEKDAASIP